MRDTIIGMLYAWDHLEMTDEDDMAILADKLLSAVKAEMGRVEREAFQRGFQRGRAEGPSHE